jgi:diacylglycerol kinase (ATP)
MKRFIYFIINPKSGEFSTARRRQLLDFLSRIPNSMVLMTEYAGHATVLATQLAEKQNAVVVAVGGDGTVNEVASALIGSKCPFGIVPFGSGNGLARHLGISMNYKQSVGQLQTAQVRNIDVCYLNDMPFFCTAGIGFDADVAHVFSKKKKRGLAVYVQTTIKEYFRYKPTSYSLSIEDQMPMTINSFSLTFANAAQFGNDAYIAPNALIDDGLFDISILKPFNLIKAFEMGYRLFGKTLNKTSYMRYIRASKAVLNLPNATTKVHLDGEAKLITSTKLTITIKEKSLNVLY